MYNQTDALNCLLYEFFYAIQGDLLFPIRFFFSGACLLITDAEQTSPHAVQVIHVVQIVTLIKVFKISLVSNSSY